MDEDRLDHDFCPSTSYCRTCGQHVELVAYRGLRCLRESDTKTVVAMSHRRFADIGEAAWLDAMMELPEEIEGSGAAIELYITDAVRESLSLIEERMRLERQRAIRGSSLDE